MAGYTVKVMAQEDYRSTAWSGGTTTELAIAPEGSVYAERDFLWRISSATVDLEESTFTSLPDYNRLIMTLQGGIRLSHNGGEWLELPSFTVHAFDGGDETVSVGKVIDFNLMMRKGRCTGEMVPVKPDAAEAGTSGASLGELFAQPLSDYDTILVYCWEGTVEFTSEAGGTYSLTKGESIRLDGDMTGVSWDYVTKDRASFVAAAMRAEK